MKTTKTILGAILGIFIALFVYGAVYSIFNPVTDIPQSAIENTSKNSFISGCKPETMKIEVFTDEIAQSYCECAYDTLNTMYPDFNDNEERDNRIINEGYTQAETDEVVKCIPAGLIN